MTEIEVGDVVEVQAGAYTMYLGPDEPDQRDRRFGFAPRSLSSREDEVVHRPPNAGPKTEYKALLRHPLKTPLRGIYLGWCWKATGVYLPGQGDYESGLTDQAVLDQDKRHRLCCVHILSGDYWKPPFKCLASDMKLL